MKLKELLIDTDSILIALSEDTLDEAVRPELREEWETEKLKWFADETPEMKKTPGYLKEEFSSDNGVFIGLSSKCYLLTKGEVIKRSQKGTPRYLGQSEEKFRACLFHNEIPKATYRAILTDPKRGSCVTKSVTKKSLNPFYYKHYVSDNLVDVSPFKNEAGFL